MTDEQLKLLELACMLGGVVVGFFAGAPIWAAITTRVLARKGWSKEDEEMK